MLYLSGTWFITQSTPYTKPVWWLPACSQACSFLVRCSYALGTMHDSKFGVGGVFRTFVCFLSEGFNDHMHVYIYIYIFFFFLKILELSKLMGMLFMVVCLDVDCP